MGGAPVVEHDTPAAVVVAAGRVDRVDATGGAALLDAGVGCGSSVVATMSLPGVGDAVERRN